MASGGAIMVPAGRPWRLVAAWLVCGLAVVVYAARLALVIAAGGDPSHPAFDLAIYLQAAAHLRAGLSVYQTQVDIARSGWPYVYPPLLAELLLPFPSYAAAWWAWTALSLACWLGSLGLLLWELRARVWDPLPAEWRPVLVAGLVLWPAVLLDVLVGQIQLPLLALLCGSWWALGPRRAPGRASAGGAGRWAMAGLLLGLAMALKPLPATALVSLLAARHGRVAGLAAVAAGVVMLVSFAFVGLDQLGVYVLQAGPGLAHAMARNPNSGTLAMSLSLLVGSGVVPDWLALAVDLAVLGATALAAWRWRPAGRPALALGVSCGLLVSPILESHHLVLVYLPLLQALGDATPRQRPVVGGLAAALIGSSFVLATPSDPPLVLGSKSALTVGVLLALFIVQVRQARTAALAEQRALSGGRTRGRGGRG